MTVKQKEKKFRTNAQWKGRTMRKHKKHKARGSAAGIREGPHGQEIRRRLPVSKTEGGRAQSEGSTTTTVGSGAGGWDDDCWSRSGVAGGSDAKRKKGQGSIGVA
jgi:hypothetical protein